MGKALYIFLLFATNQFFLNAQDADFVWAKQMGGTDGNQAQSITFDASGNIYTTGAFVGISDFDPSVEIYNLTSFGSSDIFVSKLDASGNFVWAKQLGGTYENASWDIAVDGSGNVYTIGYFLGTCDFDPGSGTYNLTSYGSSEIFVSKLDASGDFVWAKQMRGSGEDRGISIALDSSGNVYTTGYFRGTCDFDPNSGIFNLISSGGSDIFVSKLDALGDFVWAKKMGGTIDNDGWSIAVDASGNVYTTGFFLGTCDFDPSSGTYNLTSFGDRDIFISKLDALGDFVWAKQMGGTSEDFVWSIAVNGNGNVYTTGRFSGTCDFDPNSELYNLTSSGVSDIFVSKLDASGDFVWAKQMGGANSVGSDDGLSIAVDSNGDVYTTGLFKGISDFDPSSGTYNLTSFGFIDIFVSKLNSSGNFVWAKQMGGTMEDVGWSIAVDSCGNVYTTGSFSDTSDFDPSPDIYNLTSFGYNDIFVVKLAQPGAEISIVNQPISQSRNVCSNATFTLSVEGPPPFQYTWYKNGIPIADANNSIYTTPPVTLTDNGSSFYCIVSNCNGIYSDTSITATLTVVPPCVYSYPRLTLNASSRSPGQSLIISGSNFTPYGEIDLTIKDESGQRVGDEISITYLDSGSFEFELPVTSEFLNGEYTVVAVDGSTGNSTPVKTFIVNNLTIPHLEIIFPSASSTIFRYKIFNIEWTDYVSSAPVNGQTGELIKEYKIEASPNNGGFWLVIATKSFKAYSNKVNIFSHPYIASGFGPYLFRITEIGNLPNTATSLPLTAIECDGGGFVASLEWDATVPTDVKSKIPYPVGLAADGTARIFVKIKKSNASIGVSTIQATIYTVGNNSYSGTALLGKIAYITDTTFNSTSVTYPAALNNNSNANDYLFWLVAPNDFTTDITNEEKNREINVYFTITYTDNSTEFISLCSPVSICRPALVFAHGFLGAPEAFKYSRFNNNSGDTTYFSLADVHIWNVVKFLDLKKWSSYQENADILLGKKLDENKTDQNSINSILKQMHFYGYANKRIDYVAHSMGGAIGRTMINNGGSWYSPGVHQLSNYGNGYINKYISICTPHNGSPIADLAVDAFNSILFALGQNSISATIAGGVLATSYFKDLGLVYKGNISQAIANLQAQSGGIQLAETTVRNHLISADLDRYNNIPQNDILNSINTSDGFGKGISVLFKAIRLISPVQNYFNTIYGSSAYLSSSDLIVPLSSQLANKLEPSPYDITTNTNGVSETSIIYGLDKQHVGIQNELSIGTRLKVLLNARMTSGFFDETIPAYSVNPNNIIGNDNEVRNRLSTTCLDTVFAFVDTIKIKITNPLSNDTSYIDSTLQISIKVKDTTGLKDLRVICKSLLLFSKAKDSIQFFQMTISPSDIGSNILIAIAEYDSIGCTVYHIDTITINVTSLDSLEGFYITPKARYLNPDQDFVPVYHVVYPTYIGELMPGADSLTFMILDTNVVVYDYVYHNFVSKDTGSTHIIFSYGGFSDTMFVYISTNNIDNVLSICPFDSISILAGVIDTTKTYQWQVDTLNGFTDIFDNIYYSGTDSSKLNIIAPLPNWYGYRYRCIISDSFGASESYVYTLRFGSVWTGAVDTAWENPANWNCNIIPNCTTDVYIPSGRPRYPQVHSEAYCRSIKLDTTASVDVTNGYQLYVGDKKFGISCNQDTTIYVASGINEIAVNYSVEHISTCGGTIIQTSGIASGGLFPIGSTTNCFELRDEQNVIAGTCCFDVLVVIIFDAIGIVGSATQGGWDEDIPMDYVSGSLWTKNISILDGELKFRANGNWDINWGNSAFPIGIGTQNGSNIPVYAGDYTVTFNSYTGEYYFDVDSDIGIIGNSTSGGWDEDTDMYIDQAETNKYFVVLDLQEGEVKFRANDSWDINWSNTDFPVGVGTQDGPNIPILTSDKYRIDFNKLTGDYQFTEFVEFTSIGIIGNATPLGWDTETSLQQDLNNSNIWSGVVSLSIGELKFRANNSWTINWGGDVFPSGTAILDGDNISVPSAGNYMISFNTETLLYNFVQM